jgi:hypothetical protein
MALIVETGTGSSTADSYLSLTDFNTYLTDRSYTSTATDAQKEAALRIATLWLDGNYIWAGYLLKTTQALGWPRLGAVDNEGRYLASDAVPNKLKQAVAEAAINHLSAPINGALVRGGSVIREKIGQLEVEYAAGASPTTLFPYIGALLKGLASGGPGVSQGRLTRV